MNPSRMAPLGLALALAGVATAASGEVIYREVYTAREPAQLIRVERITTPEVGTYNDRYVLYTPPYTPGLADRYVQRQETVVVQGERVYAPGVTGAPDSAQWNPRHPHWGHLIDYGLFNRRGPTDFGQ